MKKISEHLGQIIIALAGVALLIAACVVFKAPIGDFFNNIVSKETTVGEQLLVGVENPDLSDLSGGGNGGGETQGCDTLTWDGNTDGRVTLESPEILGCFVKISDAIPALSDCKNGMIVQTADGGGRAYSAEEIDEIYNAIGIVGAQVGVYVIPSDGFILMDTFTFPESGVWVAYMEDSPYVTSLTIPGYTGFPHSENCGH